MPKVLKHTPRWLQRPSPGYQLFAPTPSTSKAWVTKEKAPGLRKTIATRDSEIFVAVGHEIRWADLAQLKEDDSPVYHTLKVSIPLPIERLTISPNGDYLAVSTSHTVHVVVLPDSSLLTSDDDALIKPKTFQVGPTAHVLEESSVASVLWHPLGYHGRCLVTISRSGVVRLWEINRADRSSFSEPSLSIDLEKLANATNDQEDLSASTYGATKGFSPDSVDLEVASACFGDSPDQEGVHGWAPMTLWIATIAGDVYALCPLLPAKWQLVESPGADTFMQTLVSSVKINHVQVTEDDAAPEADKATADKQLQWLSDIIDKEPFQEELPQGDTITVYVRPDSVPAIPLLQGPFSVVPEVGDYELSDMVVYSLKTLSDANEDEVADGSPAAVVCLLTDTCQVHVCLDLEGIVGKWLPSFEVENPPEPAEHALVVAETITLTKEVVSSPNQSITSDVHTDFSFFVSHASGVFYVSLEPWIRKLENELSHAQTEGADFRLKRLLESANTSVEQCMRRNPIDSKKDVTSCVVIEDGNVGYLVLTTFDNEPQAVMLDAPEEGIPTAEELAEYMTVDGPIRDVREPWQPPKEFWEPFDLYASLSIPSRHRAFLHEEIRLSPANLVVLMRAHRVLAEHTETLQHKVSDLFNRCQRLQEEYRDQITKAAILVPKIDAITGNDEGDGSSDAHGSAKIEERMERVKARQEEMNARYQALRRKMASVNTTQLSKKEAAFAQELQVMESSLDRTARRLTDDVGGSEVPAWEKIEKIKQMKDRYCKEVGEGAGARSEERPVPSMNVPLHTRRQEHEQIHTMLQHQTDLLEATMSRLRNMGASIPSVAMEGGS